MRRPAAITRPRRSGLTLAELSVSLAVIATLMVAIGSIMMLTGQAVGMTAGQAEESKIDDVVATIASEQRMALTVTERTPTSITFTVADRDHDGINERIQYSWAGTGQPLMRKVNDQAAVAILPAVEQFRLGYLVQSAEAAPAVELESTTDEIVYSHDGGSTVNFGMSVSNWCAESFVAAPLLPENATSWRVTMVDIKATRSIVATAGSSWTLSLYPADASGKPDRLLPAIESKPLALSKVPTTTGWLDAPVSFTVDHQLDPTRRYCIVISQTQLATTGSVSLDGTSSDGNGVLSTSTNSGTTWSTPSGRDLRIKVYGRYKYPG